MKHEDCDSYQHGDGKGAPSVCYEDPHIKKDFLLYNLHLELFGTAEAMSMASSHV